MNTFTKTNLGKLSSLLLKKECIFAVYLILALVAGFKQYHHHSYNNYLIFKYVYWHTIDLQNLYNNYPEYQDSNHYGPIFSIFIAPFALLPDGLGCILWNIANVAILLWGIYSLPISPNKRTIIAWICAHEALTALFSFQFNIALTGLILLSFSYLIKQKEIKSAFLSPSAHWLNFTELLDWHFFLYQK
ncbi:glycosyltransferase family 87 protein [Pedobacter sp. P26]|uniref:glycosyltransferase family 87 protein n=1 Tax=Pedobacter sp. P26 TaxID=3423956 RepID=UPI003D66C779